MPDTCPTRDGAPAISPAAPGRRRDRVPDEFLVVGRSMPAIAEITNSAMLHYEVPQGWTPAMAASSSPAQADRVARLPRRCPLVVDLLVSPGP